MRKREREGGRAGERERGREGERYRSPPPFLHVDCLYLRTRMLQAYIHDPPHTPSTHYPLPQPLTIAFLEFLAEKVVSAELDRFLRGDPD